MKGVILDTNILLSGVLIPQGPSARLLAAWKKGDLSLITSEELISEFREVASRPYFRSGLRPAVLETIVAGLRDLSEYFARPVPGAPAPDPKDSFLLALAEASNAEYLVTGDKRLQGILRHGPTVILSRVTMTRILKESSSATE